MTNRFMLIAALALAVPAATQDRGRIVGRVLDATSGQPLAGAHVEVEGSAIATHTALDGRYTLQLVPAGPVTLRVRMIGYAVKMVANVAVPADGAVQQDITLNAQVFQLADIQVVEAIAERGSVAEALDAQRTATNIVSSVTAEQISRSPDSDAGAAVQRVSGVTVQDGRYVFVRGLGERYTTTSLNGSRMPSPEPERRVVPFDLFPANLLEGIETSKTFTADQPGDFSGGQVDIRTREFPTRRSMTLSTSVGANASALGQTILAPPTLGREWLGYGGDARALPSMLQDAGTLQGRSQQELNAMMRSFRNVWSAGETTGSPSGSFGASLGGEQGILGVPTGYVGSLTYSYGQEVRADEFRAIAQPSTTEGEVIEQNPQRGSTARVGVLWGGLFNLTSRLGSHTKLSFNNTYTRSADNEASRIAGFNEGFDQYFDITRLTFVERAMRSHQVAGEHLLFGRHRLDWQVASSSVLRTEPDRSDLVNQTDIDSVTGTSTPVAWFGAARSATRTFSQIRETGLDGGVNLQWQLTNNAVGPSIKVGVYGRQADRVADSRAYDLINVGLTESERSAPLEAILAEDYIEQNRFQLFINANGGLYSAQDRVRAGYGQVELPLGYTVQIVAGARVESSDIMVDTRTISRGDTIARIQNVDVLPALTVNFRLAEGQHNLRFSGSQTLSRPEYRELSPVSYFDILGGQRLFGNPRLERALIQNLDVRWEWYPHRGEVVSIAGFAKQFDRPIERVLVQTSDGNSPDATFQNAEAATNYGVELEVRKSLGFLSDALYAFSVFSNLTLMRSRITVREDGLISPTNAERSMVGQAGIVLNGGFTWATESGVSATLLYNRTGRRMYAAGILPLPDSYEEARDLLDASVRVPVSRVLDLKIDGKNLLDDPYLLTQGSVTRLSYRTGRTFAMGATWRL
ncbi:MAG: TonB-dependent receptor [Gemmatimonadales bacterium]